MTALRTVNLVLPWPPSLNRIWRAFGQRVILSKFAREYKIAAANALPTRVEPLTGRLRVLVVLHPPESYGKRKFDIANREKCMIDTLTEQRVWLDDSQIDEITFVRAFPIAKGAAILTITEIQCSTPIAECTQ